MSDPGTNPNAGLIRAWSARIDRTLADVIGPRRRVALVNFPNHRNAGDPALWLGARAALRRLRADVVYRASWASYDADRLRRALGDGVVLIQGGGNFGDLYPGRQQETRERLLADLADLPTVQLPQSIHYEDEANLDRMRGLCEDHADLTVLARDERSLVVAEDQLGARARLCPDLAMALGPLPRPVPASVDVLWLSRGDPEGRTDRPPAEIAGRTLRVADWLQDLDDEARWSVPDRAALGLNRALLRAHESGSRRSRRAWRLDAATYDRLARRWVDRGLRLLASGQMVVTDRLHGHLLSLLMGIPHVVLDNRIGKLGDYVDTWTHAASGFRRAQDAAEAAALAPRMAPGLRG